jgi:hypothetical protein
MKEGNSRKHQIEKLIEEDMTLTYAEHREALTKVRNEVIDEICSSMEQFSWAFGGDTVASFKAYIKGFKND